MHFKDKNQHSCLVYIAMQLCGLTFSSSLGSGRSYYNIISSFRITPLMSEIKPIKIECCVCVCGGTLLRIDLAENYTCNTSYNVCMYII